MCQAIEFNPHSPVNPVVLFLHLAGGKAPLVLVTVFIINFLEIRFRSSFIKIIGQTSPSVWSEELPTGNWRTYFPGRTPFVIIF